MKKDQKTKANMRHKNDESVGVKFGEIVFLEKETCLQFTCDSCEMKISNFELFLNHALSHIYERHRKAEVWQILQKLLAAATASTAEYADDTVYSNNDEQSLPPNVDAELELEYPIRKSDELKVEDINTIDDAFNERSDTDYDNFEQPLPNVDVEMEYPSRKSDELKVEEIDFIDASDEKCDTSYDCNDKVLEFEVSIDENGGRTHSSESEHSPVKKNFCSVTAAAVTTSRRRAILEPFTCKDCNKKFTTKSNLKRHSIIHSNERRFKCETCGAAFKDKSNFGVHCKRHLQIKPHQCDECDKCFATTTELYSHKTTHSNERPFVCEICGNCYSNKSTLVKHTDSHKNLRQHKCNICAKGFNTSKLLKDHMTSHSNERPFKCQECAASFKSRKALKQHNKLHSDLYEYKCQFCEKAFQQCAGLHSHVKSVHSNTKW